jgi:hypothetical protein
VDPDEIFRQFFGEDFGQAAGGAGGVRFHTFGGSNGAFVFNMGGMPAGGEGGGGGVGAMPQVPAELSPPHKPSAYDSHHRVHAGSCV